MGNKSSSTLTLSILLFAALYLEAVAVKRRIVRLAEKKTWTEARLYCQTNHIDLASFLDTVESGQFSTNQDNKLAWIGLLRDPEDEFVWKWIDVNSGEGIPGDDVSNSSSWADGEQSGGQCAFVKEEAKWYCEMCSIKHSYYCSLGTDINRNDRLADWNTASQACEKKNRKLATITDTHTITTTGWIGLFRRAIKTWEWTGDPSDYRNWAQGEPSCRDCAALNLETLKWESNECSKELTFLCYDDNLVVVNENKTWEEALLHCKDLETACSDSSGSCKNVYDLLTLYPSTQFNYIQDRMYSATTDEVWTGLRFLGGEWLWADGAMVDVSEVVPECPAKHCGVVSKYNHNWITRDCSEKRNFICYSKNFS